MMNALKKLTCCLCSFASVYRDFQDISDFSEEIKSLNQESKNTSKRKSESPKVYGICSCFIAKENLCKPNPVLAM